MVRGYGLNVIRPAIVKVEVQMSVINSPRTPSSMCLTRYPRETRPSRPLNYLANKCGHPAWNVNGHSNKTPRLVRHVSTLFAHRTVSVGELCLFSIILCFAAITKRCQRFRSEFLLVAPRQLCVFDHEKASNGCDGSQARIENEYQFEACCVSV